MANARDIARAALGIRWSRTESAARRVAEYAADLMPRWHRIDDPEHPAPKDRAVLLWWPEWWHNACEGWYQDYQWHSDKAIVSYPSGNEPEIYQGPTHWMPLPAPPEAD